MDQSKVALVVQQDPELLEQIVRALRDSGFGVVPASDGMEGYRLFLSHLVSLVVLDVVLPGRDGFSLCRDIRAISNVPILFVSTREDPADHARGLQLGADEYLPMPFEPEVFKLVADNLLRTAEERKEQDRGGRTVVIREISVDKNRRLAFKGGEPLPLSPIEFDLLSYLMTSGGRLISREALLTDVWGNKPDSPTNVIDVTVRRLREKIETDPSNPVYILTERGKGYRFASPDSSRLAPILGDEIER